MTADRVPIREALQFGWDTFKNNALFLIGVFVAYTVITGVVNSLGDPFEGELRGVFFGVISFVIKLVLEMGVIAICLALVDGKKPEFSDLFNRARLLLSYLPAAILYGVMVVIGLVFFIFPGIYLAIRFMFISQVIVDKEVGPTEALRRCTELTHNVKMELFAFGLLFIGINLLGVLCFVIGLFVSMPVTVLAATFIYRRLDVGPEDAQDQVATQAA